LDVWGIADLHLSFAHPEGRERYAERWRDHVASIEAAWRATVRPGDLVLVPGDISMANNHRDVQPDLRWIGRLPGTKVLSPGNHDRWWNKIGAIRPLLRRSTLGVGGDAVATNGVIVCGTLGAAILTETSSPSDRSSQDRELSLLDRALAHARELQTGGEPIYVLWHYPPFDAHRRPGPAVSRMERAGVSACLYGHLHIEGQWPLAVQGDVNGVRYHCVAADAIGFRPIRVDRRDV
jgi:predicted phosphohydrolase